MKADLEERLAKLSERLADQVLIDADPNNWPGAGKRPRDMTKEERGDAFWCRKNADASIELLGQVQSLLLRKEPSSLADFDRVEDEVKKAERAAADLLKKAGIRKSIP